MKKSTIFSLLLLFSHTLFSQIDIEWLNKEDGIEEGKCFVNYPLDTLSQERHYLEIVPPIYERCILKITDTAFLNHFNIDLSNGETEIIEVLPESKKWVKRNGKNNGICNDVALKYGLILCLVAVPARYITVSKEMTTLNNDTSYHLIPKEVSFKKIAIPSSIRLLSAAEAAISKNDIIEVIGGEWSEWREVLSCGCNPSTKKRMIEIEQALANLGYDIEVDGILHSETKKALLDFQHKHDLPEGRLDIETLRKLGVY